MLTLAGILACTANMANAANYKFSILAKTGDTISGEILTDFGYAAPQINDAGKVVFAGSFGSGASGIFTPSQLLVKTGDPVDGITLSSISGFTINNRGTLVFSGSFSGGSGIFTPSRALARTGDNIDGIGLNSPQSFAINDGDELVFTNASQVSPYTVTDGIFVKKIHGNRNEHLMAKVGDVVAGETIQTLDGDVAINNSGTVVFGGHVTDTAGKTQDALLTASSILVKGGGTIGGIPLYGFYSPVINDFGTVVFGDLNGGSQFTGTSILSLSDVIASSFTPVAGYTLAFIGSPAMNNPGTVVFSATLGRPGVAPSGLLTQSGLIVETGTKIDGKTLASIGPYALNNRGTVVFRASFSDGTQGIVKAMLHNSDEQ